MTFDIFEQSLNRDSTQHKTSRNPRRPQHGLLYDLMCADVRVCRVWEKWGWAHWGLKGIAGGLCKGPLHHSRLPVCDGPCDHASYLHGPVSPIGFPSLSIRA